MNDSFYKVALAVFPTVYYFFSRLWLGTCRLTVRGGENLEKARNQGGVIALFWHYSIIYLFHHLQHYGGAVLVSASRDGEFVARTAERFGLEAVRGSSNRQGVQALKKLLRIMRSGKHLGIVADGSQGPARVLQKGPVYLASRSGAPILPMAWAADRYRTFNSWDLTVVPMLFSRIVLRYGTPIHVPAELDQQGIEEYRLKVEQAMNDVYEQVWSELGKENHDGGQGRTRR